MIKCLRIKNEEGGKVMSGHSKWHNVVNSFFTATMVLKID